MGEHPRLILPGFLSEELCKELQFIHKSCSTVGYRPNVFSTTLSHLIATDCGHLIMPFVAIRERLKEKAEEFFGCEFELFIEFTGLISWTSGAKIGWHSDDNRPYLKQRDFAAVCYLNSYGKDFIGGLFHFLEGVPQTIVPMAGDAIIYTADSRNIHCVDEITNGERCTLTLWFTRDSFHCEDDKLVSLLSKRLLSHQDNKPDLLLPSPAPNNMYWFSLDSASSHLQLGFDIRWARIHILGYDFCSDNDIYDSVSDTEDDPLELLNKPLRLVRGDKIFEKEFDNSLHALQVVQFYQWKGSELDDSERLPQTSNGVRFSYTLSGQKPIISADDKIEDMVLARLVYGFREHHFNWVGFSASIGRYNDYVCSLHRKLLLSFPLWRTHHNIFTL